MAFSTKRLRLLRFSPYDIRTNRIQDAKRANVSLAEFAKIINERNVPDSVTIDDVDATGARHLEFVPHLQHYSTPRSKSELLVTMMGVYGKVNNKRKLKNLKRVLRKFKGGGAGIISPELVTTAPILSQPAVIDLLRGKISSTNFPLGICIDSRDAYIPPQSLNVSRIKLNEIIEAIRLDAGSPPSNRDRVRAMAHKYGSPNDNVSRGKFSMARQVNTKKRLTVSGRAVISILPIWCGRANLEFVALPRQMYEGFFGIDTGRQRYAIVMCYPINTLAHTPTYSVIPWDNSTIGVPSNFLAPQARDFDGDCAIVIPILDLESSFHARIIGSPVKNIFSGVDFLIKPSPHIVLGCGMTKDKLFETMFNRFVCASVSNNLSEYIKWYTDFETRVGSSLVELAPVSLGNFIFGNSTIDALKESKATRFDLTKLDQLGDLGCNDFVVDGLRDGVMYSNLFKVYAAGRRVVVESKCNIGDEGKKQNIIQFAIPDTTVEWTFELAARGCTITRCFIDMLPVIHRVTQPDIATLILGEFDRYLAQSQS